jgi:WD40 repeat protein
MFSALRGSYRVPSFIFHATPHDKAFSGYGHIMSTATIYNSKQYALAPQLVTGDAFGRIAVWNLSLGTLGKSILQEHPVRAMAQLPYNKLATADGRRVRIWKAGQLHRTLEGSNAEGSDVIGLVTLSHGRLAVASAHEVRVWDTVRGRPLMNLNGCSALATDLPDDQLASYCPQENIVRVFNTESGELLRVLPTGRVEAMTSLSNDLLATISTRLSLWNVRTGVCVACKPVDSLIMHQRMVRAPNNYILTNTRDSHFTVFDGKSLKTRELSARREDPAQHLLCMPDGRIITIDVQSLVQVWG